MINYCYLQDCLNEEYKKSNDGTYRYFHSGHDFTDWKNRDLLEREQALDGKRTVVSRHDTLPYLPTPKPTPKQLLAEKHQTKTKKNTVANVSDELPIDEALKKADNILVEISPSLKGKVDEVNMFARLYLDSGITPKNLRSKIISIPSGMSTTHLIRDEVVKRMDPKAKIFQAVLNMNWTTMQVYYDCHLKEEYPDMSIVDLIDCNSSLKLPVKPDPETQKAIIFIQDYFIFVDFKMKEIIKAESQNKPTFSIGEINVCQHMSFHNPTHSCAIHRTLTGQNTNERGRAFPAAAVSRDASSMLFDKESSGAGCHIEFLRQKLIAAKSKKKNKTGNASAKQKSDGSPTTISALKWNHKAPFIEKVIDAVSKSMYMGIRYYDHFGNKFNDVNNRSSEQALQNLCFRAYGFKNADTNDDEKFKYPFNDEHKTSCKKISNFLERSIPEYRCCHEYPTSFHDNSMLASFPIDPNVSNPQAWNVRKCFVLFTHPGQPQMMTAKKSGEDFDDGDLKAIVKEMGFPTTINCPREHRHYGCGRFLKLNDIVKIDAMDCFLIRGVIWAVSVKKLNPDDGKLGCNVGYIKCLANQLHIFANRIGYVKTINADEENYETQKNKLAVWMGRSCHGACEVWFLDGILHTSPYRLVEPWQYDGKWEGNNDGTSNKKRKRT